MKLNEITYAKTHADFLNKKFHTNYKAWMKCSYYLNEKYEVWMIRFDGKLRDGWKNTYNGDIIKDENCYYDRKSWDGLPIPQTLNHIKLVFEIVESGYGERKYIFRGVYKYQKDISNPYKIRVYKRISSEF